MAQHLNPSYQQAAIIHVLNNAIRMKKHTCMLNHVTIKQHAIPGLKP
jgi:hypothetical protein